MSRDLENAATELAQSNCTVDVVTFDETLAELERRKEGFSVHRVTNPVQSHVNIVTWALALGTEMQRMATDIIAQSRDASKLVHASEWVCVSPATQLKKIFRVPFTFSLYSTEDERSPSGPLRGAITYLERKGCSEAMQILVKKKKTQETLQKSFAIPANRITLLAPPSHTLSKSLLQLVNELRTPKQSSLTEK
jgi:hypothetical protein